MKKWEITSNVDHCPSCLAAAGQVHPLEVWEAAGIVPGSPILYDGGACKCKLVDVDSENEIGSLSDIPVKGGDHLQNRFKFSSEAQLTEAGTFEIIAITAGEGNGWLFSDQVLKESLALWNNAESFIDHALFGRSVKDLAGICFNPSWDEVKRGVKLDLKPLGPSAALLTEMGQKMLAESPRPRVGFSADVLFTAKGKTVDKIIKVYSVDLVFDPARGGEFLRVLQSKGYLMDEKDTQEAIRLELSKNLLETTLAAEQLPKSVADLVRARFKDQVFEPADLTSAIDEHRKMLSAITGPDAVQGPRITSMFDSGDQISAAAYDLLGAERPAEMKDLKTAKLSGIRELYTTMTGDRDFHGGFDPSRAQFANTTATLPGILKNVMNKLVIARWEELGNAGYRWWEKVVQVEHFTSLQQITGVLMGEVTLLPVVAEGAAYTELDLKDSPEVADWVKYGGYVGITLEMIERDELHKLKAIPRLLASSTLRRISGLVANVFLANAGIGPVMADTFNVFQAANHKNLGTTALAGPAWEAAGKAIYTQPMLATAGNPILGLDPKFLLVPRDLRLTAMQILYPSFAHESNYFSENMQKGEFGDVITVPEFIDANDWAAVADPRLAPAIILAERFGVVPEIYVADSEQQGALFTNDQARIKARTFTSVFVADYRPLFKANVA